MTSVPYKELKLLRRPHNNGQLERVHSTLKNVLRKTIADKHDWPLVLDLVLYFLRNLPHSRHGHTPYELIFMKPTPHILATLKSYWVHPENESLNVSVFLESTPQHQHNYSNFERKT